MLWLVLILLTCACSSGDSESDSKYLPGEYPTEANLFDDMLHGQAQLDSLCQRLAVGNVHSVVRDAFCKSPRPKVTNTTELLEALGLPFDGPGGKDAQIKLGNGNPAWSAVGHSASLSRRLVSPVSPRVVIHTPVSTHLSASPGYTILAFVRGEGFAEIITHDSVRNDLDFFLFKFAYRCLDPPNCTNRERFSEDYESGWTDYTVYGVEDLENTPLDCLQCHKHGMRTSPTRQRSLLMFQLNSMWMHWMYDNRHYREWTDNPAGPGPFHEMLQQYLVAHGTEKEPLGERFGGIPDGAIYGSRPRSLEDLIEGNGFGNGFDSTAYEPNGSRDGLLEDNRARGLYMLYEWAELYAMNLQGLLIAPPGRGESPFDSDKLSTLISKYSAYRMGESTEFPDVSDLFGKEDVYAVGLRVYPGLSAPEIVMQACTQCHHGELNSEISRANFDVAKIAKLSVKELRLTQERVTLPKDHLKVMPPFRLRTLDKEERQKIVEWLDKIIAGRDMADDGKPPSPVKAEFDLEPSEIDDPPMTVRMFNRAMPRLEPSMLVMRAKPGSDPRGYVEYYFEETSGNPGGTASGWQMSPRYLDMDLEVDHTYKYRVKMRDIAGNEGEYSEEVSVSFEEEPEECYVINYVEGVVLDMVDSDCDSVPDEEEGTIDTDGDGIPDFLDPDDDNDGFSTMTEKEDGDIFGQDNDNDGKPTWLDIDSDGDGYWDYDEGGGDSNDNLIPGYLDPNEPCGNGYCNPFKQSMSGLQENCTTCPQDCGCSDNKVCNAGECGTQ